MMTRFATVNSTSAHKGVQATAKNAHVQYDHSGLMTAMSSGARAVMNADTNTRISARTLLTSQPVRRFVPAPVTTMGRKRRDVWMGERDCTSWKKRVRKYCMASKTPQMTNTVTQRQVKTLFFQREGGMIVFSPRHSWRRPWRMNAGRRRTARENSVRETGAMKCEVPLARMAKT